MSANGHDPRLPSDDAFDRWYALHFDRLRALCSRILRDPIGAEDIAQETLLRAWVRRDQLRDEDIGAWLSVVARNLCISSMRKEWRSSPTETLPEITDPDADPAVEVATRESRRSVRSALARMGERHRNVLYQHEVGGADYEELGSQFGLTAAGARTVAFRARRVLREHLVAVGESFSGILVGIRVRIRGIYDRAKSNPHGLETGLIPSAQIGINIALAIGVTLAGVGGIEAFGPGRVADASTKRRVTTISSTMGPPARPTAPEVTPSSTGSSTTNRSGTSIAGVPFNKPEVSDTGLSGHLYDEGDGSTHIVIRIAGQKLWNHGRRQEGDGLDALYAVQDSTAVLFCDNFDGRTEMIRCE